MADQDILCIMCSRSFRYSDREQAFMRDLFEKGKIEELVAPKRCLECRRQRRPVPGPRGPLQAPLEIPALVLPAPKPAPPENGAPHAPEAEIRMVLVAADFEKLVCREDVVLHHGNRKIRLILADIGLPAMKEAMEKAVLSWWKS